MATKKKIKLLALGTGYVESSSWSVMLLAHRKGFKTLDNAITSVAMAVQEYMAQELKMGYLNKETTARDIMYDVIHGTLQDHGMLWEQLSYLGWETNINAVNQLAKYNKIHLIEKTPEVIKEALTVNAQ